MRQRESTKIAFTSLCSLTVLLWALYMCQTGRQPLRPELLDRQIGLFLRNAGMCFSLQFVQYHRLASLPQMVFLIVTVPWGLRKQAVTTRARRSWVTSCGLCTLASFNKAKGMLKARYTLCSR